MDSKGRRKYSQANTIFSPRRSCYGTHLWASLLIVFRRVRQYCRIRSHDVGGSAGAMPAARCNACRAMQCIGFQNGRRHADEKFWDHDSTTSEPQNMLEPPLYVGSKQTRTKFSHKWRSNEWKQEFTQVYRTYVRVLAVLSIATQYVQQALLEYRYPYLQYIS